MGAPEVLNIEDSAAVERISGEWLRLARDLPASSYFQTPDWVVAWWETVARKPATRLAIWRGAAGRIEAVVAVSRGREPIHRKVPLAVPVYINTGSGLGDPDHCGWPVALGREDEVRDWLTDAMDGTTTVLRNLDPAMGATIIPRAGWAVDTFACPRLSMPPAGAAIGRSSNFRRQLKAYARRLREGRVTFRWLGPGEFDEVALRALFRLHQRRRRGKAASTSFTRDQMFLHQRLIDRSDGTRGPAAILAEHEGRTIGVVYGFWWRDSFAAYQSGWDPEWSSRSIGTVLIHQAIEAARANGARIFDFLRGAEPYKYRFGAVDRVDTTWLIPRGVSGRFLGAKYRIRDLLKGGASRPGPCA